MSASNGIGWEVQYFKFSKGWTRYSSIYATRDEADNECIEAMLFDALGQYRVYESLRGHS